MEPHRNAAALAALGATLALVSGSTTAPGVEGAGIGPALTLVGGVLMLAGSAALLYTCGRTRTATR